MENIGINRTWLKLIAIITMTIDHIGLMLFPEIMIFRIIGRIAFPLYTYMLAEGAYYSKHRLRYLLTILGLGLICLAVYVVASGEWYFPILIGFSLSLGLIYSYDYIIKNWLNKKMILGVIIFLLILSVSVFLSFPPTYLVENYKVHLDYVLLGVLSPFIIYIFYDSKLTRMIALFFTIILSSLYFIFVKETFIEFYALFAIPIIYFYNGKKGKYDFKYFFYLYYPLHLVILYLIYMLIG